MIQYRYRRVVIRDGVIVHDAVAEMDGAAIYKQISTMGHRVGDVRYAFYQLINHWNAIGLIGIANGGPQYVYTVVERHD